MLLLFAPTLGLVRPGFEPLSTYASLEFRSRIDGSKDKRLLLCGGIDVIRSQSPRKTSGNPTRTLLKRMPAREQDTARISEKVTKSEQTSR
jgi:hypothetical protein